MCHTDEVRTLRLVFVTILLIIGVTKRFMIFEFSHYFFYSLLHYSYTLTAKNDLTFLSLNPILSL